jgi:glyoxylase-like metal-dependent hydrolase (beta-lactamase superfamily II)
MRKEERHFGPVWFIPGENRGRYPFCHSIYIEGARVLIDPASDRERLVQLRENPGVETVWLSHWHEDHFMHLDLFDGLPSPYVSQRRMPHPFQILKSLWMLTGLMKIPGTTGALSLKINSISDHAKRPASSREGR